MNVYVVRYLETGTTVAIFDTQESADKFCAGRADRDVTKWRVLTGPDFTKSAA